jgi:serine protease Do
MGAPGRAGILLGLLVVVVLLGMAPAELVEATPRWGWLGVRIRDLSEQEIEEISRRHGLREGFGAVIVEVMKETPAEASGLRIGDLVVAFQGRPVVDTRTLQRYVASASVGESISLTVLRREEGRRRLSVRLGLMPPPIAAERVAAEFGFLLRQAEPQPELAGGRPSAVPSVAVVLQGSRAAAAGLQVGDVLVEVNGRPVVTLEAAREALLTVPPEGPLPLVVRRGDEQVPVLVAGQNSLDKPRRHP